LKGNTGEVWQGGVGWGKRNSMASPLLPFKKKTRLAEAWMVG